MNLEDLTFKQIVNCIAMIKQLKETGILEFDVNTTTATLNYDETIRYLEKQNLNLSEENQRLKGRLEEINCLIHKALNDREINGIGNLNLSMILELSGDDKDVKD